MQNNFAPLNNHDNNSRTITGVICAADYYQFSDLRDGALQFFPMCLKVTMKIYVSVYLLGGFSQIVPNFPNDHLHYHDNINHHDNHNDHQIFF